MSALDGPAYVGDKGSLPGTVELLAALVSLIATLFGIMVEILARRRAQAANQSPTNHRPVRWHAILAWFAVGGVGLAAGYVHWNFTRPEVPITDTVKILYGDGMRDRAQATVVLPDGPLDRSHITLTPRLENPSEVGNCAGSARLDVAVQLDGVKAGVAAGVLPGQDVRVNIDGVVRKAEILITVDMRDDKCVVNLDVAKAVLHD
jgi:hypothetical protein